MLHVLSADDSYCCISFHRSLLRIWYCVSRKRIEETHAFLNARQKKRMRFRAEKKRTETHVWILSKTTLRVFSFSRSANKVIFNSTYAKLIKIITQQTTKVIRKDKINKLQIQSQILKSINSANFLQTRPYRCNHLPDGNLDHLTTHLRWCIFRQYRFRERPPPESSLRHQCPCHNTPLQKFIINWRRHCFMFSKESNHSIGCYSAVWQNELSHQQWDGLAVCIVVFLAKKLI